MFKELTKDEGVYTFIINKQNGVWMLIVGENEDGFLVSDIMNTIPPLQLDFESTNDWWVLR